MSALGSAAEALGGAQEGSCVSEKQKPSLEAPLQGCSRGRKALMTAARYNPPSFLCEKVFLLLLVSHLHSTDRDANFLQG